MDNNDILRRIRFLSDLGDADMIEIFALADDVVSRSDISDWLKKEDDPAYKIMPDLKLATFLNGLINYKRGKREGEQPKPETQLNNNLILRKIKIAYNLSTDEIIDLFNHIDKKISAHELSAFLRNPEHAKYRACNDQYLRNLLQGMQKMIER